MPSPTKARGTVSDLTASGTSSAIDVSDAYSATAYVAHTNGTGTITVGALVIVQVRPSGGTYINHAQFRFGQTASAAESQDVDLPEDCTDVRIVYTAPTGSTGHSCKLETGEVTGLV